MPFKIHAQPVLRMLSVPWRVILAGFFCGLAALLLGQLDFFQGLEERSLDLRFMARRDLSLDPVTSLPRGVFTNLVLIAVTDEDTGPKYLGPWPWPRDFQARLLEGFSRQQALPRAIGYDVLFTEASRSGAEGRRSDEKFAAMLQKFGNVCIAGMVRNASAAIPDNHPESVAHDRAANAWLQHQAIPIDSKSAELPFEPEDEIVGPHELFRNKSWVGFINAVRDEDGVHRRMPILIKEGNHWLPSLSLRLAMLYHNVPLSGVSVPSSTEVVLSRPDGWRLSIPVELREEFLLLRINYRGTLRYRDFKAIPFHGVLQWAAGKSENEIFNEAMESAKQGIVLVGQTTTGTDVGATPLHAGTALVDCHLNTVNMLLSGDFLRSLPFWATILLIFGLSLLPVWIMQRTSALGGFGIIAASLLLFLGGSWFLFYSRSIWIPWVLPSAALFLSYTTGVTLRFTGEERQKRQLKRAFTNYLSANIMEEVLKNPKAMELGGIRKEITVMFADVRGFTHFCENRSPEEVVRMLNELLEVISEVIFRHDGTLDKYVGDQVVAFWGAPTPGRKDHAVSAATAALEIREAIRKLHERWRQRNLPLLRIGIGLNTGEMLVGNIGSSWLHNYTVIGDEVNLAARLESETRHFDVDIILSQSTAERLGKRFRSKLLGETKVKGKEKPVPIYSLEV